MTDEWVDGPATLASADDAFHAGITQELLRGNITRAQEQNRFSYQSIFQGELANNALTVWALNPKFIQTVIPRRTKLGSTSPRSFTVKLDGKLVTSGDTVTIRLYFLSDLSGTPDSTDAFPGQLYTEHQYTLSSYSLQSDTVTLTSPSGDIWLALVNKAAAGSTATRLRGLYIRETAT